VVTASCVDYSIESLLNRHVATLSLNPSILLQNIPDERYLLAREVVKASGVDYNTSAPNVVQRWFRAIMRRAKAHGLPLPSLPRRCGCFAGPRNACCALQKFTSIIPSSRHGRLLPSCRNVRTRSASACP